MLKAKRVLDQMLRWAKIRGGTVAWSWRRIWASMKRIIRMLKRVRRAIIRGEDQV
jgi:hypothetical protein